VPPITGTGAGAAYGPAVHVLRLSGVTLRHDGEVVLRRVDWEVAGGQRWVVVGPNGAGKTTVLRIAALYQHPTSGSVEVLGQTLGRCDVRSLRRRIALSSPALADRLAAPISALEVVMTGRDAALAPWWHIYGEADWDRAERLLDRFGCRHLADHPFATLSAGERQRVLLARTLVGDPGLVLLDEPTAGLDIAGREQLVGDLANLAHDPAAPPVVLVTHHLEEVPPGFTHALVLRSGAVVARGPLADTLRDAVLSEAFGIALSVEEDGGRFTARLVR
jgi:iron complex transport system ATP-binding protein